MRRKKPGESSGASQRARPAKPEASTSAPADGPPGTKVSLAGGRSLVLSRARDGERVTFLAADDRVLLTVQLTEQGPVLRFEGASLMLEAAGDLSLKAARLSIQAREGLALSSGGDMVLQADGKLTSAARAQSVTATLGGVNVRANDDVRIDGERILLNS